MEGKKDNAAVAGLKHTFCGAMAGAITKTSVAPLERVKIIMQVHGMKDGQGAEKLGIMSTGRVRTPHPRLPTVANSSSSTSYASGSCQLREWELPAGCGVLRSAVRALQPTVFVLTRLLAAVAVAESDRGGGRHGAVALQRRQLLADHPRLLAEIREQPSSLSLRAATATATAAHFGRESRSRWLSCRSTP